MITEICAAARALVGKYVELDDGYGRKKTCRVINVKVSLIASAGGPMRANAFLGLPNVELELREWTYSGADGAWASARPEDCVLCDEPAVPQWYLDQKAEGAKGGQ
jgi:hypothetical protein